VQQLWVRKKPLGTRLPLHPLDVHAASSRWDHTSDIVRRVSHQILFHKFVVEKKSVGTESVFLPVFTRFIDQVGLI
jgi:hypothetical protein